MGVADQMVAVNKEAEQEDMVVEAVVVTVVVTVVEVVAEVVAEVVVVADMPATVGTEAGVKAPMPVTIAAVFAAVPVAAVAYTPVGISSSMEKEQARVLKLPGHLTYRASECTTVAACSQYPPPCAQVRGTRRISSRRQEDTCKKWSKILKYGSAILLSDQQKVRSR